MAIDRDTDKDRDIYETLVPFSACLSLISALRAMFIASSLLVSP